MCNRNMDEKIDKQKLLEIARKNALSMMKGSVLVEQNKVLSITAGGKTVSELTGASLTIITNCHPLTL